MLRCESLAVSFDGQPILRDVSLRIERHGLVGILGPNGSGKTTLLRALSRSLTPDRGLITLGGKFIGDIPRAELARRLAVVPQETHLAFDYTVLEIVLMGRYPHLGALEFEGPSDIASAHAALAATGTDHLAKRAFATLSGGEKQRVVIASALAQLGEGTGDAASAEGRVLLLDEPTASLDLRYQIEVASLLKELHDRQDMTIVLTTHDVHFARKLCSELVLFGDGRVQAQGPPSEVLTADSIAALYGISREHAAPYAAAEGP